MHTYNDSIVNGEEARKSAAAEGLPEVFIDHYEETGWFSDTNFIRFLVNEEFLERRRIGECVNKDMKGWIAGVFEQFSSPSKLVSDTLSLRSKGH